MGIFFLVGAYNKTREFIFTIQRKNGVKKYFVFFIQNTIP